MGQLTSRGHGVWQGVFQKADLEEDTEARRQRRRQDSALPPSQSCHMDLVWLENEGRVAVGSISDAETRAQRGEATCPRTHRWEAAKPEFKPRPPGSRGPVLTRAPIAQGLW